ncbi:universal stress protein [Pseudomonas sp. p1(2021b)]|uniref:universal stress protein n=1 Tax=Pseudomonas sp. p1(2021b) TaxID=2874628 RepID=UPI001CCC3EA9|nr:universal stress protein [Pseudomonas sp. p1(2021b)]UBM27453.1 universal stress protein [Pseudomonas sp. p1(2021b)]
MTKAEPDASLRRAVALAEASGASLHVLGVHAPAELRLYHPLPDASPPSASFVHFSTRLKALLDEQPVAWLRPTFEAVETTLAHDIVSACVARVAPDLIIKDCPARSVFGQLAQTSLDHVLLHTSEAPTLFVPANAPVMPANILVAVDVATAGPRQHAFNDALIVAGQHLAAQCKARVHLLSVYSLPMAMLANPDLAEPWVQEVRESLQGPFDELADARGVAHAHRYFVEGAALRIIKSYITTLTIDVVVVGVVQPKRWARLIGDTTERLIGHAPCSVLAVKPEPGR